MKEGFWQASWASLWLDGWNDLDLATLAPIVHVLSFIVPMKVWQLPLMKLSSDIWQRLLNPSYSGHSDIVAVAFLPCLLVFIFWFVLDISVWNLLKSLAWLLLWATKRLIIISREKISESFLICRSWFGFRLGWSMSIQPNSRLSCRQTFPG